MPTTERWASTLPCGFQLCFLSVVSSSLFPDTVSLRLHLDSYMFYFPPDSSLSGNSGVVDEYCDNIEKHMQENGRIKRNSAHMVLVGLPETGKSSLLARVIKLGDKKRKLKSSGVSTGVMDGVVTVDVNVDEDGATLHAANIDEYDNWEEVEFDLCCLRQMGRECFVVNKDSEKSLDIVHPHQGSNRSMNLGAQRKGMAIVRNLLEKKGFEAVSSHIGSKYSLYLSDAGGQVEFQELLPLLVNGTAIFIFVFPLHRDLDTPYKINHRKEVEGQIQLSNCYTSSITIRESLVQTLASIDAMEGSIDSSLPKHKPYVIIVGTHKDCLVEEVASSLPETASDEAKKKAVDKRIRKINDNINSLLKEHSYEGLVIPTDKKEVVFTVDNTCKDDDDFKKIRSRILRKVKSKEFSILFPLSYLLAFLELQTYSSPFIKRSEFLKAVSQYGLKEMDIDHCLRFLHDRVGVLRFFPFGDLKDVIVKDPQALFNMVTNLIIQSFITAGNLKERNEVERGIYSRDSFDSILYESDDVVITLDEVILLLKELRIVAPFHDRRSQKDKYFIPCVLNHLGPSERSPVSSNAVSPLGILFKCRRVPKGILGVLVHYTLTHEEGENKFWNLDIEKIFKDEVSFEVGPYDDLLTLRFFSTHLVVTYFPNNVVQRSEEYSVRAVSRRVQSTLKEGVDPARAILHYSKEKTSYSLGLECDKCKLFREVAKDKNQHIMKCPHGSYPLSYDGPWDFGGKNAEVML